MSDIKLGTTPNATDVRDAIHIAIIPAVASGTIKPGTHVGPKSDGTFSANVDPIGIADPFLGRVINAGERFWLLLYQGSITGMRHHWSHPHFPDLGEVASSRPLPTEKAESREWVMAYASRLGITFDELMDGARQNDLCFTDGSSDHWFDEEFWTHYAVLTGKSGSGNFFRCSC